MEDYPDYKTFNVMTDMEGISAVSRGEYDALFSMAVYANYLINREGIRNLTVSGDTGYFSQYSIGVPEGEDLLLSIIQKAQDRISTNRHKEINRHWNNVFTRRVDSDIWNILFFSVIGLLGIIMIIMLWVFTLRKEVKKKTGELQDSGERYRRMAENWDMIFHNMAAGVLLTDSNGLIVDVNPAMVFLCGRTAEELKGNCDPQDVFVFPKEEDAERIRDVHIRVRKNHETFELNKAFSVNSYDGIERLITITASPYKSDGDGDAGAIWIVRDVSAQIHKEREILEADKTESLKVLAGGISHDFNNLLTGIYGFVNLAAVTLKEPSKAERFLEKAEKSIEDARSLTSQLAAMSKGGIETKTDFLPSPYIRESAEFSHRTGSSRLIIDLPDDLWSIHADKGQLGQVVSNLVINAQQAMGSSGILRITGRNIRNDSGAFIEINFEDSGPGIPPEIRKRIFDPYFTTKEKGSGLGLASCAAIVSRHDGTLTVESEPGKTVFTILLPAIEG